MDDDLHALSGAYAVHALPYAEEVLFEDHLRACPGCAAEVRQLRETAAWLAEAAAEPPPATLRTRLLTAAHRRTSLPEGRRAAPLEGRRDGLPEDRRTGPRERRRTGSREGRRPGPPGGWRRSKVVTGLAAVSAAATAALGAVAVDARRDLGDLTARAGEVAAVLAAPDVRTARLPVSTGGTGTVMVSRSAGRMVFTSSGLRDLPDSHDYELWLTGPEGARPAGLLDRAAGGVTVPVVAPLRGGRRVALTVEPAGGSEKPTSRPVMVARLPTA
ncbi:anti-sigma factor [Nonomuraea sp. B1E8]|uniref:anti-sigma factor n=1 Tax=unclassified Nonomuraea TaxID=2593643 RepID=UPI00325ED699